MALVRLENISDLNLGEQEMSVVQRPDGATGPAPFKIHDEPMELCRAYMRQRAWMVARNSGLARRTSEEKIDNTLDRLFENSPPLEEMKPASKYTKFPPEPLKEIERESTSVSERTKEALQYMNTIEIATNISDRNVLMWKKLYLHSVILLVIVNICMIIFSPKWPITIIPFAILLFCFYKWKKAESKLAKAEGRMYFL